MQSVLVFGGSFDPPHRAHLTLAKAAARATNCTRILLVPTNRSPHKMGLSHQVSGTDRLEMVRLAIADEPAISVSPIELDRPPPSFTVDTLQALRTSVGPAVVIRWLMGSDQVLSFERWHEWERILKLAEPAVVLRPPHTDWGILIKAGLNTTLFSESMLIDTTLDEVSSTTVRHRIAKGKSVSEYLAPPVIKFIAEHRLYLSD